MFCVIVAGDKQRERGTEVENEEKKGGRVFLEFRVQFDMSLVLDVRR